MLDEDKHERKEKLIAALCAIKACPASGKREVAGSSIEEFRGSLLLVPSFARKDSDTRSNTLKHAQTRANTRKHAQTRATRANPCKHAQLHSTRAKTRACMPLSEPTASGLYGLIMFHRRISFIPSSLGRDNPISGPTPNQTTTFAM